MVSLKPERLKRYKDVAMLLVKYGRSDLVKQAGLADELDLDDSENLANLPEAKELATDLERLGPTFIKLGQLLSTRADLLPGPYLEALARLQDQIEPFSYEEVDRIVSSELGVRISKAFGQFDREPLAAARVPVARVPNLTRALETFQKAGFFVLGLDMDGDVELPGLALATEPVVVVVGSEGKGLSRLVRETCDQVVSIPMSSAVESLNAGVAAGVTLYEIARQRAAAR